MEKAGFVSVTERKYPVPINSWPPDGQSQRIGSMMMQNLLQAVDAASYALIVSGLGWTLEALEPLLSKVKSDVQDRNIHGYVIL